MTRDSFRTSMSKALTAMTVMLVATLILATNATAEYKILHQFRMPKDGSGASGNLTLDAAGNLYGATRAGGAYGFGVVFKLKSNPDGTWTESLLHSFTGADGKGPNGGLIFDSAGNLYGTTYDGGANGSGVVFKLKPNPNGTWTESVLYNFQIPGIGDGSQPISGVIFDAAGDLYGMTKWGAPVIYECVAYELTPNPNGTWAESALSYFFGPPYVCVPPPPDSGLIFDATGNLYGTTEWGGFGNGEVFKLTPNPGGGWTQVGLYNFSGYDGNNPLAGVILDTAGNIYGTTASGGASTPPGVVGGFGEVFKLTSNPEGTWELSILYSFTGGADGGFPEAELVFDEAGNLFGTTASGGTDNQGVVFKLTPSSDGTWSETVLHTFTGYGANPLGGLIMDATGTLYGTVSQGSQNNGFVFEITKCHEGRSH